RRKEPLAGGGHGGGDEPKRRPRHSRAGLRGGERLHQGRKDHPELHRRGQQDGVAEVLNHTAPYNRVKGEPMLPPIPYNGAMRPTLMVAGMAALFLLVQRTRRKPCYGRLLWAASAIYLLFLLYATLLSRTAGEEYSYRIEPLVTFRRAFAVEGGLAVA